MRESESSHDFSFPCGIGLTIRVSSGILSFVLTVPEELNGTAQGLVGNFNGNDTDDFIYPNGTVLSDEASDREIHHFGQACKLIVYLVVIVMIRNRGLEVILYSQSSTIGNS